MQSSLTRRSPVRGVAALAVALTSYGAFPLDLLTAAPGDPLPSQIPVRHSSQIADGFGSNITLPRSPSVPWNQWWWTRIFDAGIKWARIGQYDSSSDLTSWDWVERRRGVYSLPQEADDAINSLVENGVEIELQLEYGNPLYTSLSGIPPQSIAPAPGSLHTPDRSLYSIFWPPRTPEQIDAFMNYVTWMVRHFRGRVHYYELWNEQDGAYWNPDGSLLTSAEEYGRLLKRFPAVVHSVDPSAKIVFGGQSSPNSDFARRALEVCQCASEIDVFPYHTYPAKNGRNIPPEQMDDSTHQQYTPRVFREELRNYHGVRRDVVFWDNEFNAAPDWPGFAVTAGSPQDESAQAKYVPRGYVYNLAAGVKTFVWELIAATDGGNNFDRFGMIHGRWNRNIDFTPRPVFYTFQNASAVFADTHLDSNIEIGTPVFTGSATRPASPFMAFGFRSAAGKALVAYWLAADSLTGNFRPDSATLTIRNSGIERPVLVDITSGAIRRLAWKDAARDILESIPVTDGVAVVTDASYFDWDQLPEAPSGLEAQAEGGSVHLRWRVHSAVTGYAIVERRDSDQLPWREIARVPADRNAFADPQLPGPSTAYQVRLASRSGKSASSNIARPSPAQGRK